MSLTNAHIYSGFVLRQCQCLSLGNQSKHLVTSCVILIFSFSFLCENDVVIPSTSRFTMPFVQVLKVLKLREKNLKPDRFYNMKTHEVWVYQFTPWILFKRGKGTTSTIGAALPIRSSFWEPLTSSSSLFIFLYRSSD